MKGTFKRVCHEYDIENHIINNWRTSLVPAPAVIPAPRECFKVVAVKTLVVIFNHDNNLLENLNTYIKAG